jgi:DNA-directed RNA polymerase specialized sigma24 family protein
LSTTTESPRNLGAESNSQAASDTTLAIENIVKRYGDLLFDLCDSVLWSPSAARLAFRAMITDIKKRGKHEAFVDFERAWVLNIACSKLRDLSERYGRKLTPAEQIELDSIENAPGRIKKFDSFFHRLNLEDQLLLLLKDKYGIPMAEISTALGAPEGSLKLRRAQALRAMEDWLWGQVP